MPGQAIIKINNSEWQMSIASTAWERVQGLGGIPGITAGTGMFFDLGYPQVITVTTIPMLFALDIAFLDENLLVTEIYRDIQPGYLVNSTQLARYFLEVNSGELTNVNPGDQANLEITGQAVIVSTSSADWLGLVNLFLPLIMGMAFWGMLIPLVKSLFTVETKGSQLLAATRKKTPDLEVEILEWGSRHKLVKIYRNGRVYAATYAEPFPTKESARADYLADPSSFIPFDESTGRYLLDTHNKDNGKFRIKIDRLGNLVITHSQRTGKDIFLQFEADKELVYSLLRREERKDLEAGWPVEIADSEPRALTLWEIWQSRRRVWVRLGDRSDYEDYETPYEAGTVIGWTLAHRNHPGTEFNCRYLSAGVEIEPGFTQHNYISLYWGDAAAQWERELTAAEKTEFERGIRESLREYLAASNYTEDRRDERMQNSQKNTIPESSQRQGLDYLPDSPEFLAYTIEDIGYREKIDRAFQEAIQRARRS